MHSKVTAIYAYLSYIKNYIKNKREKNDQPESVIFRLNHC